MHLTILTLGSRGDVQPYVALGVGLQAAGFRVRLATYGRFRAFVESYGLDFFPMSGDPKEMLETEAARRWLDSDRNPIQFIKAFIDLTKPRLPQVFADSVEACRGADAIIYSVLGLAGFHVAEKMDVPAIMTHLQPFSATREFPSIGDPLPFELGGLYNLASHWITDQIFWQPFRSLVNQWRVAELGLRPLSFWGPYRQLKEEKRPILYGFSPSVIPKPADWPAWLHITGYWFLDQQSQWQPPAALLTFLASDPPPLYVGFGSMTDREPQVLQQTILAALAQTGQRAVWASGWGGLQPDEANVFVIESVPHDWLFPRVAGVVHHGGAGTTAAGLRAGVPSLLVPYFADQHFWARRVAKLGVGPQPIPRAQLTTAKLATAMEQMVQDAPMRARAAALGTDIGQEKGVETAVRLIQAHLA